MEKTRVTLLERIRDGADSLAWQDFLATYWRPVYLFARKGGCSEQAAEDIVQEVVVKVFEQRNAFQYDPARGQFRNWLFTLTRNQMARRWRRHENRPSGNAGNQAALDTAEDGRAGSAAEAEFEAWFEAGLLGRMLDAVKGDVAPATYQAFELLALHRMPAKEVAVLTGLSVNAVSLAKMRVVNLLKEMGATYRETGQLGDRLKQVLDPQLGAGGPIERSLTAAVGRTLAPRGW